jgi:Reverse transcriptase (RNA-dependent DNA polymerase)
MIIGADLLSELGIEINFSTQRIIWEGIEIPMKGKHIISDLQNATTIYYQSIEPMVLKEAEARQKRILDADYSALDLDTHAHMETHLSKEQHAKLICSLQKYPKLFRGGLGVLNVPPVHLELRPLNIDEKPYHARPFLIPKCYEDTTKKEIQRLCGIGGLTRCNDSEWAAPTFIQPRKTGNVRVLTDFRVLNKYIKRKLYTLPKISDILQKLEGFTWATALDLSMGYCQIVLDTESSYLCTMLLPWGKYGYCCLPMGLNGSPDIFQAIINDIMGNLPNVRAYLDDIVVTTAGSYEDHLKHVELVLQRLTDAGFAVNLRKSSFAVTEIDYLGYWITRRGIQPQPKKVEAIMRLTPPTTKRQLRRFLDMINYYCDMWRRRSHILAPLTAMCFTTNLNLSGVIKNKKPSRT